MRGIQFVLSMLLTTALLLPALAASAITARHEAVEAGCKGKYKESKFNDAKAKLEDPKKIGPATMALRNSSTEGCTALVEWLNAGAPNGDEDDIEDVVGWVGRSDVPGALKAVLAQVGHESDEVREEAIKVLEERLVELTAEEAAILLDSPHAEVRKGAVGILAGHHSIGQIELVQTAGGYGPTIPMWVEQEFYGHADPPPAAHVAGLDKLIGDKQDMVREHCGRVMGRMFREKLGVAPNYGSHLVTLIGDAEEDTAETSAYGAGWGCPPRPRRRSIPACSASISRASRNSIPSRCIRKLKMSPPISHTQHFHDCRSGFTCKLGVVSS